MPETAQRKPGAVASLRPHVSVPVQARQALLQVTPVNIAAWALAWFLLLTDAVAGARRDRRDAADRRRSGGRGF